jgi:hypothetical protein
LPRIGWSVGDVGVLQEGRAKRSRRLREGRAKVEELRTGGRELMCV